MNSGRRFVAATGVVLLFTALTLLMTYPQIRHMRDGVSDRFDPLLNAWALAWVADQLPRDPARIFDANIFYPEKRTLAYSEVLIVPALMVAPIRWLGGHPVVAYNVCFLLALIMSGAGTTLLVWSLTRHLGGAILAGVIFAFLPFRFDHWPHLQLQITQWIPLALWMLHRTFEHGRWRDGLWTGALVAFQALSCLYLAIFFATYLIPFGLVLLIGCTEQGRLWAAGLRSRARRAVRALPRTVGRGRDLLLARDARGAWRALLLVVQTLAMLYLLLAAIVHLSDGFLIRLGELRVSARNAGRLFAIALGLAVLALTRRLPSLVRRVRALARRAAGPSGWTRIGRAPATLPRPVYALAAGVVLAAVLTAPLAWVYMANREVVGERGPGIIVGAELQSYLAAPGTNRWYGELTARFAEPERRLLLGVAPVALAIAGAWPPWSAVRAAYLAGLAVAFDISLGFSGLSYGWLYEYVAPYRALRVAARAGVLVGFSVAVLAGFGLARICRRLHPTTAMLVCVAASAVTLLEFRSAPLPLATVPVEPPEVYRWFEGHPPAVLLELPIVREDPLLMYYSTFHGQTLISGYSGFFPPSYGELLDRLGDFPSDGTMAYLRSRGVDYIVVHADLQPPDVYVARVAQLDGSRAVRRIGRFGEPPREAVLYEVMGR